MAARVFLQKKITNRIAIGRPWIFSKEIGSVDDFEKIGTVVSVFSSNGSFVGKGYYNPDSKISIRLLTRDENEKIDSQFFKRRMDAALQRRNGLTKQLPFVRIVAGEADGLPGLIVDKLMNTVVFQITTLGMELWKPAVVKALLDLFPNDAICEMNKGKFRLKENLETIYRFWTEKTTEEFLFKENNVSVAINLKTAPRMGLYWEQLTISRFLQPYFDNRKALDAFCYHGFNLFSAMVHKAVSATGIDWSQSVIAAAEQNKTNNPFSETIKFVQANAFDELNRMDIRGEKFDLIILDPPAMAGVGRNTDKAVSGYERLLRPAIKILSPNGLILITMSGFLFPELLLMEAVNHLARKQHRSWRIIDYLTQGPDHPVLWSLSSSRYFCGWLLQFD